VENAASHGGEEISDSTTADQGREANNNIGVGIDATSTGPITVRREVANDGNRRQKRARVSSATVTASVVQQEVQVPEPRRGTRKRVHQDYADLDGRKRKKIK
jgi:hypothetical protein